MGQPRPLFSLFLAFSNKLYNFYNKSMWKMSCPSSIQHRDWNPRPLEHESSPLTTESYLMVANALRIYWINSTTVFGRHFSPNFPRLADKLWQDVDPKDFACKPEIRVPQSVVFSQPGANVTLSCFIIGTPMPDAKWVLKVSFIKVEKVNKKLWVRTPLGQPVQMWLELERA